MNEKMDKKPYRSCYYLESAVVFFPEEITFCCDRQSPESMTPIGTVEETVEAFLNARAYYSGESGRLSTVCGMSVIPGI